MISAHLPVQRIIGHSDAGIWLTHEQPALPHSGPFTYCRFAFRTRETGCCLPFERPVASLYLRLQFFAECWTRIGVDHCPDRRLYALANNR